MSADDVERSEALRRHHTPNTREEQGERSTVNQAERDAALQAQLLDAVGQAVIATDLDGAVTYWNRSATALYGWTAAEALGRNVAALLPQEADLENVAEMMRRVAIGERQSVEFTVDRRDGIHIHVEVTITPTYAEGGSVVGTAWVSNDITERRRTEDALRKSDEMFRALADNINDVFWIASPELDQMYYISPGYEQIWGRSAESLYADPYQWVKAIVPEDRECTEHLFGELRDSLPTVSIEYRIVRPDGTIRWIHDRGFQVHDGEGNVIRLSGVAKDITARKQAEEDLRASERRFSDMMGSIELMSVMLDRNGQITYCNDFLLRSTGWQREEVVGRNWFDIFLPPELVGNLRETFSSMIAELPTAWHHESQILSRDGTRRLVVWNNSVLQSAAGDVIGTASIGEDITERRLAEKALRVSEERFRTTLENLMEGCQIIGRDWRYIYLNESAGRHNRRPVSEQLGRTMMEMFPGIEETEVFGVLRHCMRERVSGHIETEFFFGDGTSSWFEVVVEPIPDGLFVLSLDITERKRVEQELRWKTAFLAAQVQSSIDGILVVDGRGKRILQNQRMNELFRIPQHILDDEDDSAQLHWVTQRCKDPEQFLQRVTYLYSHHDEIGIDELELEDGTILDRYSSPVLGDDGIYYGRIWVFHEITERRRAERENLRLAAIVESTGDAIISMSIDDDSILSWNQGASRLYGYAAAEIVGKPISVLIPPGERDGEYVVFNAIRRGETVERYETLRRRKDGTVVDVSLTISPLRDANGKIVGASKIAHDVTERKQAERALKQARDELESRVIERTRDLSAAIEDADRANRAKSEFLSRMSHELRTPLNSILGFGQILNKQALSPLQAESVQFILKGGRHLLDLINEVLDIARVEAGRIELSIEPTDLVELGSEAAALVRPLAAQCDVRLDVKLDASTPHANVLADRQRLKQVLINLLSNAIKYNRPGGLVEVSFSDAPNERFRIAVRDTGPGISAEGLMKLFTPFERLDAANSDVEGTGLGLALSQRLVIAMGGAIDVESVVGRGSTFSVELPRAPISVPSVESRVAAAEETTPAVTLSDSYTILSVEDNVSNIRLLEAILADRPNISLLSAMQGSVGLDLARQHSPNLILLDMHLPDIPGSDVLSRLKQSEATRDIPVIVISADATPTRIEKMIGAGARAYLTKPLDIDEFVRTMDGLLRSADDSPSGDPK